MDIDSFLRDPLSRRRLMSASGVSLAGGSAAFLAACGDDTKSAGVQTGPDESDQADVEILNSVLDLELMSVAAYKASAALLTGDVLQVGKAFLEQEQEHVDGLAQAIKDAGGTPNRAKSSYDFPKLSSQNDALRFAVDHENTVIAAHLDALPKFSQRELRATAAAIVTTAAEHVAVLLGALGDNQVADAFVTGKKA